MLATFTTYLMRIPVAKMINVAWCYTMRFFVNCNESDFNSMDFKTFDQGGSTCFCAKILSDKAGGFPLDSFDGIFMCIMLRTVLQYSKIWRTRALYTVDLTLEVQ